MDFTTPFGVIVTIREQNGADDDVLSNAADATNLVNLNKFLSGIILSYDGKALTPEDILEVPLLDKYCILFNSRIHSLGADLDFTYNWGPPIGEVAYKEDLFNFIFDYSEAPTPEILLSKPNAIPFYPLLRQKKDLEYISPFSERKFLYDIITGKGEQYLLNLPLHEQTKNKELVARNLRWVSESGMITPVVDFSSFTPKELSDLRRHINAMDPVFGGQMDVPNPMNPQDVRKVPILSTPGFFFLEGV